MAGVQLNLSNSWKESQPLVSQRISGGQVISVTPEEPVYTEDIEGHDTNIGFWGGTGVRMKLSSKLAINAIAQYNHFRDASSENDQLTAREALISGRIMLVYHP